jgi:hypothetical protein
MKKPKIISPKSKPNYQTAAEDAAIRRGIAGDPDTREMTAEEIKAMKPHVFGRKSKAPKTTP